jgi:hypothetical protein
VLILNNFSGSFCKKITSLFFSERRFGLRQPFAAVKIAEAQVENNGLPYSNPTPDFAGATVKVIPAKAGIQVTFMHCGEPEAHGVFAQGQACCHSPNAAGAGRLNALRQHR